MRVRHPLLAALAATAVVGSLAMAPAVSSPEILEGETDETSDSGSATGETEEEPTEPVLLEKCTNPGAATVITPDTGFDDTVSTPIGAGNAGPTEDAGRYQLDLAGRPEGTTARVRMTLSWDTPAFGDYDLIINGNNALATDSPERHSRTLGHCQVLDLETIVFTGLPTDVLTLEVETSQVNEPIVLETSSEG